ncbi:hypothetical protein [Ferrovibrio sp.]|uniref:hypothetical protein n=1 Tax=Ferrovibrio sp. TaxID=1917215 RepID=UPI003D0FE0DF
MAKKPTIDPTADAAADPGAADPAQAEGRPSAGEALLNRLGAYVSSGQALLEERMRTMPSNQLALAQQHLDDTKALLAGIAAMHPDAPQADPPPVQEAEA